jgi:hypothetical protein
MKRLLPLTAMYTPDEIWTGKKFDKDVIGESLLKSFMFESLQWCDVLLKAEGQTLISLNNKKWNVTKNTNNMPCFETLEQYLPENMPQRACITKCDILARNGIVHELDYLMLSEIAETRPPSVLDVSAPIPVAPRAPVVFAQPVEQPIMSPTVNDVIKFSRANPAADLASTIVLMAILHSLGYPSRTRTSQKHD